ncbi:penicillin acylase family protein [Massilia yuzhufengensis]|uniref:Acyl-homoserine-lactone acylase n=1 Tax=Massilia yuzhufengensis TaxID=1164594 RepID=A0A1I1LLJ3_9BURK|nr:penicillin acylase family protein [Massilia yuzhufengensis]SFC73911.1 acyl-homoserine-lactone acylase [Massilia yuzhufengensis]
MRGRHHAVPFTVRLLLACALALALGACSRGHDDPPPPPPPQTASRIQVEVARTTHGVPHVRADDFRSLGYGLAYAYAQDNVCMFADSVLTVRGERSLFFGAEARPRQRTGDEYGGGSGFMDLNNEESDFFFKGYLDIEQLRASYAAGAPEPRLLLEGFTEGYNRYLKDQAGKLPAACVDAKWVRPVTLDDMYLVVAEKALHASGQAFARDFVAAGRTPGAALSLAKAAPRKLDASTLVAQLDRLNRQGFGSNALAVGKDLSANGRGLLLGNPHYPWATADRFYQAHLTVPGKYDAMGVIIGGVPAIVIGFNRDVAWSHTVTSALHFTTFRLALDAGDPTGTTYMFDGERRRMTSKTVSVESLLPGGLTGRRSKTFYFSHQGAVISRPAAGMTWTATAAYVLADPNRYNTRMLEQWLGIGTAASVRALKDSLDKVVGLPWVNTVAADRDGNTLYADASVVPHMNADKFANGCLLLQAALLFDGSRSSCGWGQDAGAPPGIYAPATAPWLMRTDYVGNSNDSYWLANPKALLVGPAPLGYSPLYGRAGVEQTLRTRVGFRQLEDLLAQRSKLTLVDMQALAFSNRVHAAELVLPELLAACAALSNDLSYQACNTLQAWDRRANVDSRGAVLFREFWSVASAIPNKWATPFNPADPVHTPAGVAPAAMPAMLAALRSAAEKLQSLGIPLDGRLGDWQVEPRNGVRIPLHGGNGNQEGTYSSLTMRTGLTAAGYVGVHWGQSYIQTVSFDEQGPVAQAMLTYGQSTDPKSPWYADQTLVYSRKEWPVLPFTAEKIKADLNYMTTTLRE